MKPRQIRVIDIPEIRKVKNRWFLQAVAMAEFLQPLALSRTFETGTAPSDASLLSGYLVDSTRDIFHIPRL